MTKPFIYQYLDYKALLKDLVKDQKSKTFSKLAEKARIQRTYLSKVLHDEKSHLSADQFFALLILLGLTGSEKEYAVLIHAYQSSALPARRDELLLQIKKIQKENLSIDQSLQTSKVILETAQMQRYYLHPSAFLIHVGLTIDLYRINLEKLRTDLGVSTYEFENCMDLLSEINIIRWDKDKKEFAVNDSNLHLSKNAHEYLVFHMLVRSRSMEQMRKRPLNDSHFYSVTFSADETTMGLLQDEYRVFIVKLEKLIHEAPAKKLYQLQFDLFPWME